MTGETRGTLARITHALRRWMLRGILREWKRALATRVAHVHAGPHLSGADLRCLRTMCAPHYVILRLTSPPYHDWTFVGHHAQAVWQLARETVRRTHWSRAPGFDVAAMIPTMERTQAYLEASHLVRLEPFDEAYIAAGAWRRSIKTSLPTHDSPFP